MPDAIDAFVSQAQNTAPYASYQVYASPPQMSGYGQGPPAYGARKLSYHVL